MWIRFIVFLLIEFVILIWWLCSYRKGEFKFQNDKDTLLKKIALRAKGGYREWRKNEDFWFDVAIIIVTIIFGFLILK